MILGKRKKVDVSKYFVEESKNDCVRYVNPAGTNLEIFIPTRYRDRGYMYLDEYVHTLGIVMLKIGDIEFGLQLPAMITIDTTDSYETVIDDTRYFVAVLEPNRRLMTTLTVLQNDKIPYFMWSEFLFIGNIPRYLDYSTIVSLYDQTGEVIGQTLGSDHAVFEVVLAHLFRDQDDITKYYRNTDMRKDPVTVTLKDVSYGPSSTHSRIFGSYANEGRNSALLNHVDNNNELEDLFRT